MYKVIKQYVIEPFARVLFGNYEAQERRIQDEYIVLRRMRNYVIPSRGSIDEICWNELGREAG